MPTTSFRVLARLRLLFTVLGWWGVIVALIWAILMLVNRMPVESLVMPAGSLLSSLFLLAFGELARVALAIAEKLEV